MFKLIIILLCLIACGDDSAKTPEHTPVKETSSSDSRAEVEIKGENDSAPQKVVPPPAKPEEITVKTLSQPTSPNPTPIQPPPTINTFNFTGNGTNGIYSLIFKNIPKEGDKILIYWGYDSPSHFREELVNGRLEFETTSSWGFGDKLDLKCDVLDKNQKVIASFQKNLLK